MVFRVPNLKVEDFDDDALAKIPQARAGAIYLIDNSILEIFPNGTGRMFTHIAVQLKNKEGRERFAEISIPRGRGVHLLWARTLSPDRSQSFEPKSIHDLGSGTGISMIRLEDNSIVDYAYEQLFDRQELPGVAYQDHSFLFGGHEDPMLISRFAVKVPKGVNFRYSVHPSDFDPRIDRRIDDAWFVWEQRDIEGVKKEQFQPSLTELVHSVRISTIPDYVVPQRQMRSIDRGRMEQEARIRALAEDLGAAARPRGENRSGLSIRTGEDRRKRAGRVYRLRYALHRLGSDPQSRVSGAGAPGLPGDRFGPGLLHRFEAIPGTAPSSRAPVFFDAAALCSRRGTPPNERLRRAKRRRWIDFPHRFQAPGQGDARALREIPRCAAGRGVFHRPDFEHIRRLDASERLCPSSRMRFAAGTEGRSSTSSERFLPRCPHR